MVKLNYLNKYWLFIFFFLTTFLKVNSQTSYSFIDEINQVEKKFDVTFSYIIKNVDKVQIKQQLSDFSSISEVINYLNSETYLEVTQIDQRFISIAPKQENIKICGYLLNVNYVPISAANISISGSNNGAVSDENGKFIIDGLKISDYIEISHLGYKSININVNELMSKNSDCVQLTMLDTNLELNEVFIKNYVANSLSKLEDGTIQLDTKKFDILSGQVEPDLLQTSQILPGIESINESISNINVRGGAGDQNVILWDNIKMYNPTHFFGLISAINPYLTKNISIIKNGTSAKYNDGVSSTILLNTDSNIQKQTSGGFRANLISFDGFITVPIGKNFEFNTSFRKSNNNWINTPTYKSFFNKTFQNNKIGVNSSDSDFNFYDINVSLLFNISEKHNFKLNYIKINNELNYFESIDHNFADKLKQNSDAVGLTYNLKINNKLKAELSGYNTVYSLLSNNYQNNHQQLIIQENEVIESSLKAVLNYSVSDNIFLETGYQLTETGVLNRTNVNDPFYNRIQKNVMLNQALFAEAKYKTDSWFIRSGIRFNYFSKTKEYTIEPRININYSISNTINLNFKYEAKSQYTSQVIDYLDDFLGVETRRWVMSDNTIPLLKSSQFSFGGTFKTQNLIIDVSLFHKNVKGVLISGQGFQNQIQDKRINGSQNSEGAEFLLNKRTGKSDFWLSYTFSKNELLFKQLYDKPFPSNNDFRHSFIIGFNYHFNKYINTSISSIIKSANPFTNINKDQETTKNGNTTVVNYDLLNNERLNPYNRIDFSISYNFLNKKAIQSNLKFGILNVLNKKQILNTYYIVNSDDTSKAIKLNTESLAFTPNFALTINF
jgi:hypothetical protein